MPTERQTYTAAQVREAEEPYLQRGVPLMRRASAALAAEVAGLLTARVGEVAGRRLLVLVGPGNNGGDALHAAAILAGDGATVQIVPVAPRMHRAGLEAALAAGATLAPLDESVAVLAELAERSDVLLDGLLGTGTTGSPALRGRARDVVAALLPVLAGRDRSGSAPSTGRPLVVAVDLPSGIGVDDGSVPDTTVLPADLTVTFGGCKAGLVREPAAALVGRLVVVDIGIQDELDRITRRDAALDG